VAFDDRVDVEESIKLLVLGAFVTWYVAIGDFSENSSHIDNAD
jgi:hypothetical protein